MRPLVKLAHELCVKRVNDDTTELALEDENKLVRLFVSLLAAIDDNQIVKNYIRYFICHYEGIEIPSDIKNQLNQPLSDNQLDNFFNLFENFICGNAIVLKDALELFFTEIPHLPSQLIFYCKTEQLDQAIALLDTLSPQEATNLHLNSRYGECAQAITDARTQKQFKLQRDNVDKVVRELQNAIDSVERDDFVFPQLPNKTGEYALLSQEAEKITYPPEQSTFTEVKLSIARTALLKCMVNCYFKEPDDSHYILLNNAVSEYICFVIFSKLDDELKTGADIDILKKLADPKFVDWLEKLKVAKAFILSLPNPEYSDQQRYALLARYAYLVLGDYFPRDVANRYLPTVFQENSELKDKLFEENSSYPLFTSSALYKTFSHLGISLFQDKSLTVRLSLLGNIFNQILSTPRNLLPALFAPELWGSAIGNQNDLISFAQYLIGFADKLEMNERACFERVTSHLINKIVEFLRKTNDLSALDLLNNINIQVDCISNLIDKLDSSSQPPLKIHLLNSVATEFLKSFGSVLESETNLRFFRSIMYKVYPADDLYQLFDTFKDSDDALEYKFSLYLLDGAAYAASCNPERTRGEYLKEVEKILTRLPVCFQEKQTDHISSYYLSSILNSLFQLTVYLRKQDDEKLTSDEEKIYQKYIYQSFKLVEEDIAGISIPMGDDKEPLILHLDEHGWRTSAPEVDVQNSDAAMAVRLLSSQAGEPDAAKAAQMLQNQPNPDELRIRISIGALIKRGFAMLKKEHDQEQGTEFGISRAVEMHEGL